MKMVRAPVGNGKTERACLSGYIDPYLVTLNAGTGNMPTVSNP
jgi:hypothetical protein